MKTKRVISVTAAICLISMLLCSCKSTNTEADITVKDTISEKVTSETSAATTASETTVETTAAVQQDNSEMNYLSDAYVDGDYYVEAVGMDGEKKFIYYRPAVENDEAYVYMHRDSEHPESLYGYVSFMPQNMTASEKDFVYNEFIECINEAESKFATSFFLSNGDDWSSSFYEETEYAQWLNDYFCNLEPEFLDVNVKHEDGTLFDKSELEEIGFRFKYNDKLNPNAVYFCANPNYLYSGADIIFADYNGRYAARISLDNFYEVAKLMESGEAPAPEQLAEAYGKSYSAISDWFYVDDEFIVELMEKSILCGESDLPQVNKGKNYDEIAESADIPQNITQHFDPDGAAAWEYKGEMNNITFSLPSEPPIASDTLLMWSNDDGFVVKITDEWGVYESTLDREPDRYEKFVYEEGRTNFGWTSYASYYDSTMKSYYDVFGLYSPSGKSYRISCYYKSEERTSEYGEFVKSVFGSVAVNAEQKADMENAGAIHAPLVLSETPSRFNDEGYYLADSYAPLESDVYKAYTPGIIWASFYAVDYDRKYETGFEVLLEKKGADGLWYEVLPIGDIRQANSGSGRFYHATEEARNFVQLDLACYPLLTEGDYRIVKPFWEEGKPEAEYGAFYEFKVSEDCYKGEPVIGAVEIEKESYSADVREISYTVTSDSVFSVSSVADIERCVDGVWKSVRKGGVETNSIGGSYSIGAHEPLSTADFDLSVSGEYRIRISVGEVTENLDLFTYNYNTLYGYFNIE